MIFARRTISRSMEERNQMTAMHLHLHTTHTYRHANVFNCVSSPRHLIEKRMTNSIHIVDNLSHLLCLFKNRTISINNSKNRSFRYSIHFSHLSSAHRLPKLLRKENETKPTHRVCTLHTHREYPQSYTLQTSSTYWLHARLLARTE